jgi:hypothetical protein
VIEAHAYGCFGFAERSAAAAPGRSQNELARPLFSSRQNKPKRRILISDEIMKLSEQWQSESASVLLSVHPIVGQIHQSLLFNNQCLGKR